MSSFSNIILEAQFLQAYMLRKRDFQQKLSTTRLGSLGPVLSALHLSIPSATLGPLEWCQQAMDYSLWLLLSAYSMTAAVNVGHFSLSSSDTTAIELTVVSSSPYTRIHIHVYYGAYIALCACAEFNYTWPPVRTRVTRALWLIIAQVIGIFFNLVHLLPQRRTEIARWSLRIRLTSFRLFVVV